MIELERGALRLWLLCLDGILWAFGWLIGEGHVLRARARARLAELEGRG